MEFRFKINFCADTRGFSTAFDVFLFLIMVSISAIILLPAITGNTQIISAVESKSQKQSSHVLLTLLNGRVDEFGYTVAGNEMDIAAGTLRDSSVYQAAKKLIAGRELKHRTFADLAADNAAAQWVIYHNGKRVQLNFLMNNYTANLNTTLKNYLNRQMGDRYNYNLKVVWRPIVNVPIGGDVGIGEPVPKHAYTESTYITMPYHVDFTRKHVEGIIDSSFNSSFGNITSAFDELKKAGANRTVIEAEISQGVFDSINGTIDYAIEKMVQETIEPILEAEGTTIGQVNNLLPGGGDNLSENISGRINSTLKDDGADIKDTVTDTITSYLQSVAKEATHDAAGDEIKALVTDLADMYVNNAISIEEVKDHIYTEIFARISINRAQVILSIWEKRV